MVTPKLENYKKVLDDFLMRFTIYWVKSGWIPGFLSRGENRFKRSNREAVEELKKELNGRE